MNILKLSPVFKEVIWGADKLKTVFNKQIPSDKTGESWEISCHKDGLTTVIGGKYDKMTLDQVLCEWGATALGSKYNSDEYNGFPLLVKLIDANDNLSVQVHPDDEYAMEFEGELGKTEMWYVVGAEEDSKLVYGFNKDLDKSQFRESIENGTLGDHLNFVSAKEDDAFFIKSGTVHAIGRGIMVYEIQENSNTTYRIFDWNRVDKNGKGRELHIDKALDVSDTKSSVGCEYAKYELIENDTYTEKIYERNQYFCLSKIDIESEAELVCDTDSFMLLTFIDGNGKITGNDEEQEFTKGNSFFVPAGYKNFKITGKCTILKGIL